MRMFRQYGFLGLAALALCAPMAAAQMVVNVGSEGLEPSRPDFFRQRKGKGQGNRRGKGKRNPPRERANRLHISKRVRRQHRRARSGK